MSDRTEALEEFKQEIRSYLIPFQNGIAISALNKDYVEFMGRSIPYRELGFRNDVLLFRAIPDAVRVVSRMGELYAVAVTNEETAHVAEMVSKQKKSKNSKGKPSKRPTYPIYEAKYRGSSLQQTRKGRPITPNQPIYTNSSLPRCVPDQIKKNIQSLLTWYPKGLSVHDLKLAFKTAYGVDLRHQDYDYKQFTDFLKSLASERILKFHEKEAILTSVSAPIVQRPIQKSTMAAKKNIQHSVLPVLTCMEIPENIQQNIYDLLKEHSDVGIPLSQIEWAYKVKYRETLPWQYFKFQSVLSMLKELKFRPPIQFAPGVGDDPRVFLEPSGNASSQVPNDILIPEDAVLPGQSYTPLAVPYNENEDFAVCVTFVESPGKLWLQMISDSRPYTNIQLENLMNALTKFYHSREEEKYRVPEKYLLKELICAVLYPADRSWLRGCVVGKHGPTTYEIFYYDYGTRCIVEKHQLRLLKKCFASLPAQAFSARLANVQPVNSKFSKEATEQLTELCSERKPLIAQIISKSYMNTFSVILCDISTNRNMFLNDILATKGYVKFSSDQLQRSETSCDRSHLRKPIPVKTQEPFSFTPNKPNTFYFGDGSTLYNKNIWQPVQTSCGPGALPTSRNENQPNVVANGHLPTTPNANEGQGLMLNPNVLKTIDASFNLLKSGHKDGSSLPRAAVEPRQNPKANILVSETLVPLTPISKESLPYSMLTSLEKRNREMIEMGTNLTKHNNLPSSDNTSYTQQRFCKTISFTDKKHAAILINFLGKPCFTSADVSSFVFGIDIIKRMLHIQKYPPCHISVSREELPSLFDELEGCEALGFSAKDPKADKLVLYSLPDVLNILAFLDQNIPTVVEDIKRCIVHFNTDDIYWTTKPDNCIPLEKGRLKAKLADLNKQKKSILQAMLNEDSTGVTESERLLFITEEIEKVKLLLAELDPSPQKSVIEQATEFLERLKLNS